MAMEGIRRRIWLLPFLKKIKEEDLPGIDEKMEKISQQMAENEELCVSEIRKLQMHYLEKKKKRIIDTIEFIEENNDTISDYSLIDNHKELTRILSELEINTTDFELSTTYMYIREDESKYTDKVNEEGTKLGELKMSPDDICVTENGNIYITDNRKTFISCQSPLRSVSTVISTDPLVPFGICQSVDGGLLVTLRDNKLDNESDVYELESHSRRLVRHITVTGDVIHEHEYQEDGHTRLFTLPGSVTQNSNSDICVQVQVYLQVI
ncbi:uncharacterized protein LOC134276816 [Saccostrea cucullata]|uniref:uncharacterized protein LOC134276816 n=1 Tax=Saccostrea cuccullata TaxID=36930 RepID=UPI002ED23DBC